MNAERRDHLNRAQATRHVAEKILQPDEVVSYCAPAARVLSLSTITQWFRQCLCRKSEGAVPNALGADWFLVLCSLPNQLFDFRNRCSSDFLNKWRDLLVSFSRGHRCRLRVNEMAGFAFDGG